MSGPNRVITDASASPRRFYRLQRDALPRLADGQFILIRTNNVTKIVSDPNAAYANRIIGNAGGSMDATGFVDPANVDAGADGLEFHWIITYPTIDQYTDAGTTGYRKPVLSFVPRALAQEPSPADSRAPGVRYNLYIDSRRTGLSAITQFQSQVVQSALSLALYNDCQTQVEACPTCICTIAAALPTSELTAASPQAPPSK